MKVLHWSILLILFLVENICQAQGVADVSGRVVDAQTKKPIPFANVYFNNSSFGAVSDSLGNYRINKVPVNYSELVSSSIGYKTGRVSIQLTVGRSKVVSFALQPDAQMLSNVVVSAKRDNTWREQYSFFKEIFLGSTPNAALAEIINPSVLNFTNEGEDLVARANRPIEIVNSALGYRLFVTLQEFVATRAKEGVSYRILIATRFDTLRSDNGKERERWRVNRIRTYNGSMHHFLRSLIKRRATEEGFQIFDGRVGLKTYQMKGYLDPHSLTSIPESKIKIDTLGRYIHVLPKGIYQINYTKKILPARQRTHADFPFPMSWLLVDKELEVNFEGEPTVESNLFSVGYFDSYRLADLLPKDFDLATTERISILDQLRETTSIQGIVTDEANNPLVGAEVFVNNGLTHTVTNTWGQFELPNISAGKYSLGFYYGGKRALVKMVEASAERNAFVTAQLIDLPRANSSVDPSLSHLQSRFQQLLFEGRKFFGDGRIVNPEVLKFVKLNEDSMEVHDTAPLIIESSRVGYQWKCFLDRAVIVSRNKKDYLAISGLVSIDTLPSSSSRQRANRLMNQYDEYNGTLNNFISCLFDGRSKDEGFQAFVLSKKISGKPIFKKVLGKELIELNPDTLLIVDDGKYYLKIPEGLELHYKYKRGTVRFYKGYANMVLRLHSDEGRIAVMRSGQADVENVSINNNGHDFLKRLPVDYQPHFGSLSREKELVFVKAANLQLLKAQFEKTYVQTDKPYYYPGDTIWLKAYMKYAQPALGDSLSGVLYIDLVNPLNKTIDTRVLRIEQGGAWGEFTLPFDILKGDYTLRAYTQWMRNFGEVYSKPLPILAANSFIESSAIDTAAFSDGQIKVVLNGSKKEYRPREEVKLEFTISEKEIPVVASLSVAVTDQSAVAELKGLPTIQSLEAPFQPGGDKLLRIKYPVERAITLSGRIYKDPVAANEGTIALTTSSLPRKPQIGEDGGGNTVSIRFPRESISKVIKVRGREFKVRFDFNDTSTAILKATDKDGRPVGIQIDEFDSIKNFVLPPPLIYKLMDRNSESFANRKTSPKTLKEVIIRAKRIPQYSQVRIRTDLQIAMGQPDYLYEGYELENLRHNHESTALLPFLKSKVPDFVSTGYVIANTIPGDPPPGDVMFWATHNGGMGLYQIYLNGSRIGLGEVITIRVPSISRIEVYNRKLTREGYFTRIVSVFTEPFMPHILRDYRYKFRGFDTPLMFKTPPAKQVVDERATVYWNPQIRTDDQGKALISFPATDVDGTYKLTLEGATESGKFFRAIKIITIKK